MDQLKIVLKLLDDSDSLLRHCVDDFVLDDVSPSVVRRSSDTSKTAVDSLEWIYWNIVVKVDDVAGVDAEQHCGVLRDANDFRLQYFVAQLSSTSFQL